MIKNRIKAIRYHGLNPKWDILLQVIIGCHNLRKVIFNAQPQCLELLLLFFYKFIIFIVINFYLFQLVESGSVGCAEAFQFLDITFIFAHDYGVVVYLFRAFAGGYCESLQFLLDIVVDLLYSSVDFLAGFDQVVLDIDVLLKGVFHLLLTQGERSVHYLVLSFHFVDCSI